MSQLTGQAGTATGGNERELRTLASRADLPVRVRQLLDGVLDRCATNLVAIVTTTLDEIEQKLFKMAEQSRNNEQQYRCFESLREIKRGRADVTPRYMLAVEDDLVRLDQPRSEDEAPVPGQARAGASSGRGELALVDTSTLEESLALQEFIAKIDIHQAGALYALGHRFAVLIGSAMFEPENLPIGPKHLSLALEYGVAELDICAEHRVLLYRTYGIVAAKSIATFYDSVNAYFVEHRILPHLVAQAPLHKTGAGQAHADAQGEPSETAAEAPSDDAHVKPPGARAAMPEPGAGHAPAGPAMPPPYPPLSSSPLHLAPADERDSELFTTLRELLAGRRHALGVADAPTGGSYVPSGDDLQSVLGALQSKPIAPISSGGRVVQRSVAHLKQDLLAQLRQLTPDGHPPQLNAEDSDTIDLVGMLFDYIAKNLRPHGSTQTLMTKLQVPLLRVALRDKSFFTRRAHPARQLLNAIAETGVHWLDDSEGQADRALVDKMQLLVDRVNQEFDGDLGLIENMLSGLSQHMRTLARKAEVTERRHVDAARGREKLTVARERASQEISNRIAAARPNKLVRTVLEQAWTDVLALTLLRQGEDSEVYKKRLEVADQLIAASANLREGDKTPPQALRKEIEIGLDQVGYHKDDIQAVVKRLFLPQEAANEENPSSNTEIAIKLKSKQRLGEDGKQAATIPTSVLRAPKIEPDSKQAQMFERLKTLPFGTWFEFRTNQQGDKVRRKLAWFSTLTGRCLFVNQRGVRTDEKSLQQLACDVVAGNASIVEPEQESVVDRAWKAIVASLKQLIGSGGPTPASAPA